jgi:hypothetical protein
MIDFGNCVNHNRRERGGPRAGAQSLPQKPPSSNHQQQLTAFEPDTRRSAVAAGMGLLAPHLPFAIPAATGSIGWTADIRLRSSF